MPSLPDTPPNFLIAAELSQHVTPVAVVPDVVDDLVDDAASDMGASNDSVVPLVDERERYIDQLLAEIESLQVRLENCSHSFPSLELEQTFHFLSIVLNVTTGLQQTRGNFKHICVTIKSLSVTRFFVTSS